MADDYEDIRRWERMKEILATEPTTMKILSDMLRCTERTVARLFALYREIGDQRLVYKKSSGGWYLMPFVKKSEYIRTLDLATLKDKEVAEKYGVSESTVFLERRRRGMSPRQRSREWVIKHSAEIMNSPGREIEKRYNVSAPCVSKWREKIRESGYNGPMRRSKRGRRPMRSGNQNDPL